MPRAPSARRYAQAVFQIASEADDLDGWSNDLALIAEAFESTELSDLLDAPQVPTSQKLDVIGRTFTDRISPLARNLVSLLATRGSTHLLPGVLEQYRRFVDAHRGVEQAEVVSAVPLDDAQQRRIADLLEAMVGMEIRLTDRVDPEIVGGIVARVGDRVIDGSTRTRLEDMRRSLVGRRA